LPFRDAGLFLLEQQLLDDAPFTGDPAVAVDDSPLFGPQHDPLDSTPWLHDPDSFDDSPFFGPQHDPFDDSPDPAPGPTAADPGLQHDFGSVSNVNTGADVLFSSHVHPPAQQSDCDESSQQPDEHWQVFEFGDSFDFFFNFLSCG
jgi:hypothetical protein